MEQLEWYDVARIITSILALFSMQLLGLHYIRFRKTMTSLHVDFWWAINAMLLLLIVGSVEQIVQDVSFGSRTALAFLVSAVFLRGTVRMTRNDDSEGDFP